MGEIFYWRCLVDWWGEWDSPQRRRQSSGDSVVLFSCVRVSPPLCRSQQRVLICPLFPRLAWETFSFPCRFTPLFFDGFLFWTLHYRGKRKSLFNRSLGSASFDNMEAQNSLWEKGAQKLLTVHSGLVLVAVLLHMHIMVPWQLTRQVDHGYVGILFLEIGLFRRDVPDCLSTEGWASCNGRATAQIHYYCISIHEFVCT